MELTLVAPSSQGISRVARRFLQLYVAVIALGVFAELRAEEAVPAIYQRSRDVAFVNSGYGGGHGHHGGGQWGGGFYNPGFGIQFYAGTWYQRPDPDHLIYNNVRSRMVPMQQVTPDCPCLETPVQ